MSKPINQQNGYKCIERDNWNSSVKFTYTLPQYCDNMVTEYHRMYFFTIRFIIQLNVYVRITLYDIYNVYIRNSFNIEMFNSLCEPGTNFVVRRHCRTKFFTIWLRKIVVRIKYDFCICRSSQNCSQKENIANFLNKTRETILTIFFIFHLQN